MASKYYPWAMEFTLPAPVPGFKKHETHEACYSLAHKNEVKTWSYSIPYDQVEKFIATVSGGELKPGPGARKAPGHSKLNRRVTG